MSVPPGAGSITDVQAPFKAAEGYNLKALTFTSHDDIATVYKQYKDLLGADGWVEDSPDVSTVSPSQRSGKFQWECGFDTPNLFATLYLHLEPGSSGETKVVASLEYLP